MTTTSAESFFDETDQSSILPFTQFRVNCVANVPRLELNLLSCKSQNLNSLIHHPSVTNSVMPPTFSSQMARSIDFDNQSCFGTIKIGGVFPEWMLSPEFHFASLPIAKQMPE